MSSKKDSRTASSEVVSITPLLTESERVLAEAIKHFGLTVQPAEIVCTIQTRGKKNAHGWYWQNRWQNGQPAKLHEINLCAESLKVKDMGETLLHELAHAENAKLGVKDCSGSQCHNKRFKAMAERLGLVVGERDKRYGYGFTELAEAGAAFLAKIAFKRELFELARLEASARKKVGSRLIKCSCPACDYTVRVTRQWLDQGCPTCPCGEVMEEAV